ncbi:MAG: RNA polymerase sigma factor [Candidatus Andeanibacterium colombiense]|uniref:RNA polymerase sigma factor n=1 Tax=Candidatus Andeanibacterium colombiense TaxID=3121345 RepID=A0AAJ5XBJ9_9SPHN|nr:MAG: RNA polymerase sigma factor [Sphingomonadaceae bacterium]
MSSSQSPSGLEAAFLEHRAKLLRFLASRGAGDSAEDVLHEVWLKIAAAETGPIAAPLAYLYRACNMLMIDRYRSSRQAEKREQDWTETMGGALPGVSDAPSPDRAIAARQQARLVAETLDALGERPAAIFRRHRIDDVPQRQVAEEFKVSLSTVESDLRLAYRVLAQLKERLDEA